MKLFLKIFLFIFAMIIIVGEVKSSTAVNTAITCAIQRTDYVGNSIYVDGQLDKILLPNGYIKNNKYHFYIRDHLGNNRVVMTTERISIDPIPLPDSLIAFPPDSAIIAYPRTLQGIGMSYLTLTRIVAIQRTDYYPSGLPYPSMLNPQEQPYKFNGKEFDTMHGLNMYDYSARHYDAAIARWHVPDALAEMRYSISPYTYTSNNPISRTDPTGMLDDWYLNLNKGRVEYQEGNKDRFNEGLIHLAADDASIGDIEDALSSKNFEYRKDASVEGGFRVDTEKQYKGWAATQIFSPEIVGEILFISLGTGGAAEKVAGRSAAKGVSRVVAQKGAEVAAKGGEQAIEQVAVHGNSLKSMRPTWGYKLYSNDGTFLKNGITSKTIPQTRYTRSFMENNYMVPIKQFPNRKAAWDWEYQQNLIQRGPLNFNMH